MMPASQMWTLRLRDAKLLVQALAVGGGAETGVLCLGPVLSLTEALESFAESRIFCLGCRVLFRFLQAFPSNTTLPFESLKNKTQTHSQPPIASSPGSGGGLGGGGC